MADKSHTLVVEALQRAAAEPAGMPLFGKTPAALFARSGAARQAAQLCQDQGYLRLVRSEPHGKTIHEICAITEKGLAFLLAEVRPKQVLESLVQALNARQDQIGELLASARKTQANLEALKATAEKVLQHIHPPSSPQPVSTNGAETWVSVALSHLTRRQASGALEDCPLAELYRVARQTTPTLTLGQFHDGLRRLHERQQIYLHPWTGPLFEIPEPTLGLLVGHEIAYYASARQDGESQFHITSENTEDTFDSTDNLQDAIRIAREVAQKGPNGDPVCIEHKGKNIWQFVLMPNGKVAEEALT